MASPGNIDSADKSVGDTASDKASAVPPTNPSQGRAKPVSAETSIASSEAPSSNSANDEEEEEDDDDDNLHSDDGNNEVQNVGVGGSDDDDDNDNDDDDRSKKASSTKKRKMVKRSREERLEMNRMTARERRRKAKVLVDTLQERVNELTRHNEALREDNTLIRAQMQAVTAQNAQNGQAASVNMSAHANAIGGRGMAVSSSPSPVSALSFASLNSNDSSAVALLIRQLQQQQQAPQMSSPANPSPGLQQLFQASSTVNPTTAPAAVQALDPLRQQNALRMLSLQVPMPVQRAVSGISANGATNFAVPGTISLPTSAMGAPAAAATTPSLHPAPSPSDLATSALSAYRQQQPMAPPAQINLHQLVPNNVAATTVLQNLGLLGGTGALPTSQAVGLAGATTATNNATANANAALSSPSVAQGTTNASANIGNTNALAQLLPALLQQQQQQQQQD